IDPPYNTGLEFTYPDRWGRFPAAWLSMMLPRLHLARQLLRTDGVLFASIDDHEVHHLRLLLDEVFGARNFIATIVWQKVFAPKNSARHFSVDHDYILVYARAAEQWRPQPLPRTAAANARYANPDQDPRGPWSSSDMTARNYYSAGRYTVTAPG